MANVMRGSVAGATGVAAMAGVITSLRRAMLDSEELAGAKWHPEKVVESVAALAGIDEFDDQTRRRYADAIHYGYGAFWGAAFAYAANGYDIRPLRHGVGMGAALWVLGFGLMLPAVDAHPPFWTWRTPREFVLTGAAHVTWGLTMAAVLKALRD